jgi:hypothetical protein
MPNYPWHSDTGTSSAEDAAAAALLAGTELPAECPPGLQPAADVLAALRAGPASGELAGEAAALAEFRQRAGMSTGLHRSRRRRRPVLTTLLSAKAAAAIAVVGLSGAAAAAYTGSLPAPVQRLAHDLVGAPASQPSASARPTTSPSPVGPNPTGSAAYGLCTAYAHAKAHGTAKQRAVAFRNLAAAAGGPSNVAAFCAAVPHPGSSHSPNPTPAPHPTGKPTSHPTGKPTSHPTPHPTGKPTSHPTGKPTSHSTGKPTSHPTGKPVS